MGFKLTYNQIGTRAFQMAIQKLSSSVVDGLTAYKIKKITSKIKSSRTTIADEYKKEIVEKYAKRDENGKYNIDDWTPVEEKQEEMVKAQEEFGKKELFIDRHPLTFSDLKDIKMTADEQDSLGELFDDSNAEEYEVQKAHTMLRSVK